MSQLKHPLGSFYGGVKLRHWKKLALGDSLDHAGVPQTLVLPLHQYHNSLATPIVKVGQTVAKYELLAEAQASLSSRLHAPSSGRIVAIEDRPIVHRSNLAAPCIVIATDGEDSARATSQLEDWQSTDPAELTERILGAGIVGLGGAVFPTAIKVDAARQLSNQLLLINGAECEPYIACDESLMRHRTLSVLVGSQIIALSLIHI